ncbi:type II secretion system protein N [Massilia suwonensis]|uniref:Type II secretion system protein N n=1 Tax=Massilia suwonensis TaxID=648895 RepID=A0ABW0ML50_9BURK
MKRLPLLFTLLALIFLAVSATYWGMQLYKPQQRPIAAAPPAAVPELSPDAAATLFGGQAVANVATNYQLTGIVSAGRDSVAIIVAEGQPPKALKVGRELSPGVSISEVHPRYIMLSEGGVMKRIDLAADTKPAIALSGAVAPPMPVPPQMARPSIAPAGALPTTEPQTAPGAVQSAPPPGEVNPVVPQGQEAPQEPPQEGPPADVAPPPNQPQMPAPTRSANSPVNSDNPVR